MMSHPVSRIAAFGTLALALAAGSATAQDGPWVLTNARIFTVTRGVIERGTIVIRDGLIAAVRERHPAAAFVAEGYDNWDELSAAGFDPRVKPDHIR